MTDLSHATALTAPKRAVARGKPWPLLPYLCVFVAGAAGLLAGRALGGDAAAFESRLLLLLRFMAVVKFLGVIAAGAALHWRLTYEIERRTTTAYLAALAVMAAAPGLIWSLGGIALGALLFHVGLLAFLSLAWADDRARLPFRSKA